MIIKFILNDILIKLHNYKVIALITMRKIIII